MAPRISHERRLCAALDSLFRRGKHTTHIVIVHAVRFCADAWKLACRSVSCGPDGISHCMLTCTALDSLMFGWQQTSVFNACHGMMLVVSTERLVAKVGCLAGHQVGKVTLSANKVVRAAV